MALAQFEVFIQERLRGWDENIDLASGSTVDTQVIQPILRRLGTDPFTVDAATFILERLTQAFPDIAQSDGDGTSDVLIKPLLLLWDPIIREIQRVKSSLSVKDPSTLTIEESEALGANLFTPRKTGDFAIGPARLYFTAPQPRKITPANFVTSRSGLHYFPNGVQSISAEEMLVNKEADLYYFDINVVAEAVGEEYNIEPGELSTIANVDAAVRITNKVRFRNGVTEEDAETYIGRLDQSLTERSLTTLRGIAAKVGNSFPEISRLAVVGFNDPEMQRDIIQGGSLGRIIAYGFDGTVVSDGEYKARSRRFYSSSTNFVALLGSIGPSNSYVITVFDAFGPSASNKVQDLPITRIVDTNTIEVAEQVFLPAPGSKSFVVRRRELTLSGIPGGILVPDSPNGTVTIEPDKVHIGGMTDIHIRGSELNTGTLVIDVAVDDNPLLSGTRSHVVDDGFGVKVFELQDLVLGVDYQVDDLKWVALENAREFQYTLQIVDGVVAGAYRVLDVIQVLGASPILYVSPEPLAVSPSLEFRWRLITELTVDLVEPKETRLSSVDGQCLQNSDVFTTISAVDFDALGVSVNDILRIHTGANAGDYTVIEVVSPGFTTLRVDRDFVATVLGVSFSIFRANTDGGVVRPLVRITSVDLLDTNSQPVGSKVPYAKPVDAVTTAFANSGNGIKVEVADATLGIVSLVQPIGGYVFGAGGSISLTWDGLVSPLTVALTGTLTALQVVNALNAASLINPSIGVPVATQIIYNLQSYVGIIPVGRNTTLISPFTPSVLTTLFGNTEFRTAGDVRSVSVPSWTAITPSIDPDLDALYVVDGVDAGTYSGLVLSATSIGFSPSSGLRVQKDFAPQVVRSIRVGSRSLGSVRLFFIDPTSMEVDQNTEFSVVDPTGVTLLYKPDPTLRRQLLPALPNGEKPKDGSTTAASGQLTSTSTDFSTKGLHPGDIIVVDFMPVTGSVNLADPVLTLALKDFRFSYDNTPDKIVTFINDVGIAGAVSRDGVAEQINVAVGEEICSIVETSPGVFNLQFNPTKLIKIREQSSNPNSANPLLGFSNVADTTNLSPNAGEYVITAVSSPTINSVIVTPLFLATASSQQFSILRRGSQRISTTEMSENTVAPSLYYWDVELVSEGPGDLWNIPSDLQMKVTNYRSDGYYLTTEDSNISFSAFEDLKIHLSKSILEVGVDDDPDNSTQLSGQSLSISYEYSSTVSSLHSFIVSDTERVVNENPLARFLSPHFVRFELNYVGGSTEADLLPILQKFIREVLPDQALQSSGIQKKVSDRGSISITNPIDLLALVFYFDRTIYITRSKNELTTGRLAAFIPDIITLKRVVG